ncbi:MAG: GNAT family N-acetyltransferase [Patescibacteria group bacterium]|jgi:ribosomal protein S18 acetylase RimI-like enzyme
MSEFRIVSATKNDLKACEWLGKFKEFKEASGDYVNAKFLSHYLSRDFFLVIKKGQEVVGYLVAEKLRAGGTVIWYLAVKPKYRDHGLGHQLLEEFEARCRKHKIEWINLYSLENKKTLNFYKSLGYSAGEREEEFIKLLNVKKFKDLKI